MSDPSSTRAARGVRIQFFVSGALFATWGVHVPTVKAHYGLGEQQLAIAMLAAGAGALVALARAGGWVGRWGPRAVTLATGAAAAAGLALLLASTAYPLLLALMFAYGMTSSLFDVAMNAEASEIEHRSGRTLMSGFHALFSLGGMAGSAVGAAVQAAAVPPALHLGLAAVVAVLAVAAGASAMLPVQPDAQPTPGGWRLPRGSLALMGTLAAMGLLAEGAMYDWSVLFLQQERRADGATAALGYASFSAAMAAARFGGDRVRARMAPVALLRASGLLAAAGMVLALLAPWPWLVLVGFAAVGLGFANVVPVLFAAASRVPGTSAAAGIAAVSSLAYVGMMAGPPLIGVVAEHASLAAGLGLVIVFALALAASAGRALKA
jgi:predicted MFS family arabinose efflux permease